MGFREQAAAIPRVWSAATTAASTPRGEPCRNREMGVGCKNFTANCLQTTDPPPDVTTGKNRKSPGNRRKNSSGSDLHPLRLHPRDTRALSSCLIWVSEPIRVTLTPLLVFHPPFEHFPTDLSSSMQFFHLLPSRCSNRG